MADDPPLFDQRSLQTPGSSEDRLAPDAARERTEPHRRELRYRGDRSEPGVKDRAVVPVDGGLATPRRHPHGLHEADLTDLFGQDTPVVLDFHGYPSAVHELLHGRGYVEEDTTTPYDLLISNGTSRHDLAVTVLRPPARRDPHGTPPHRRRPALDHRMDPAGMTSGPHHQGARPAGDWASTSTASRVVPAVSAGPGRGTSR
ncbi:phosphoketolase [Streptomyces sp. enrichment culture]|uniref:phosphoketolase family protein n=1 Tax=Streptomyces sp. enrichment culture TaxID=1795815 RepID=UPI003F55006A